ncbi:MAG: transposase [Bacteroidota bacterium]
MDRQEPIVSNEPYHIYNRGNNRQTIFHDTSDYSAFLVKLNASSAKNGVTLVAYVVMANHFHLLVVQRTGGSIPKMMESLGTSTAKRHNVRYGHIGHVFQGPYRYVFIPTLEGVVRVARYIHLNPVRAGLVKSPEEWLWSDFRRHVGFDEGFLGQGASRVQGNLLPPPHEYAEFVRLGIVDIESVRQMLYNIADEQR